MSQQFSQEDVTLIGQSESNLYSSSKKLYGDACGLMTSGVAIMIMHEIGSFRKQQNDVLQEGVAYEYLCLPPTGSGDILFFPVRLSVCPSVRLSVRHKSCPL